VYAVHRIPLASLPFYNPRLNRAAAAALLQVCSQIYLEARPFFARNVALKFALKYQDIERLVHMHAGLMPRHRIKDLHIRACTTSPPYQLANLTAKLPSLLSFRVHFDYKQPAMMHNVLGEMHPENWMQYNMPTLPQVLRAIFNGWFVFAREGIGS
jgi:hypothetical protein